jgi:hypothetical protein
VKEIIVNLAMGEMRQLNILHLMLLSLNGQKQFFFAKILEVFKKKHGITQMAADYG